MTSACRVFNRSKLKPNYKIKKKSTLKIFLMTNWHLRFSTYDFELKIDPTTMSLVFSSLFKNIVFGKAFWEGIKSGSLKRVARRKFWPLVIVALKCLTLF